MIRSMPWHVAHLLAIRAPPLVRWPAPLLVMMLRELHEARTWVVIRPRGSICVGAAIEPSQDGSGTSSSAAAKPQVLALAATALIPVSLGDRQVAARLNLLLLIACSFLIVFLSSLAVVTSAVIAARAVLVLVRFSRAGAVSIAVASGRHGPGLAITAVLQVCTGGCCCSLCECSKELQGAREGRIRPD